MNCRVLTDLIIILIRRSLHVNWMSICRNATKIEGALKL